MMTQQVVIVNRLIEKSTGINDAIKIDKLQGAILIAIITVIIFVVVYNIVKDEIAWYKYKKKEKWRWSNGSDKWYK